MTVVPSTATCTWAATASATWIAILEGANGTGAGAVKYAVSANSTDARSGTLTIGGQIHTISQQAPPPIVCSYVINPTGASFDSTGGSGSVAVAAPATCSWTATTSAGWIAVTGGSQGSGNGTVAYTVARNNNTAGRSATIAIADKPFAVTQSGEVPAPSCEYSVSPVQFDRCMPAGTLVTTITTQASCPWTATPNVSWLTVASGQSGNGSGQISIAYSSNYDGPREGIVMVRWPTPTAGQNVRVAQAGCRYAVTKTSFSFGSVGGSGTFDVLQQSEPYTCGGATQDACVWTATSHVPWITITSSMPRAGDNPVAFIVAPNDSAAVRSGSITVRDQVVTITQAGR